MLQRGTVGPSGAQLRCPLRRFHGLQPQEQAAQTLSHHESQSGMSIELKILGRDITARFLHAKPQVFAEGISLHCFAGPERESESSFKPDERRVDDERPVVRPVGESPRGGPSARK